MAKYGMKWLDSDMHLCEPHNLWDDYIEPAYKKWAPRWSGRVGVDHPLCNRGTFSIGDIPPPETATRPADCTIREERFPVFEPYMSEDGTYVDAPGQLRAMETEGIDMAILFPTLAEIGWQDPNLPNDVGMALARAYNDWLYDFCKTDPQRLKHNALVPIIDVPAAEER